MEWLFQAFLVLFQMIFFAVCIADGSEEAEKVKKGRLRLNELELAILKASIELEQVEGK